MANIFEAENEYRIVDVDQIYLNSPYYVEIVEPVNYKDAEIILERNGRGGFDFEYGNDDTVLEFGGSSLGLSNGKDEVMGIFNVAGTDANVKFQHYRNSTLIFEAYLIGSSEDLSDDTVSYRIKRYDLGNKFKTRFSTPIDVEASEDLDGNSISPLTLRDMSLHSKALRFVSKLEWNPALSDASYADGFQFRNANDTGYWLPELSLSQGEIEETQAYANTLFLDDTGNSSTIFITNSDDFYGLDDSEPTPLDFYHIKYTGYKGVFSISIDFDYDMVITETVTAGEGATLRVLCDFIVINSSGNTVVSNTAYDSGNVNIPLDIGGSYPSDLSIDFTQAYSEIELNNGDEIYCYMRYEINGTLSTPGVTTLNILHTEINQISIDITLDSILTPTNCEGAYYNELLDKLLEYATGESGMLESTLFTNRPVDSSANACAGLNFITNGYKIRQRTQNLIASIKDMLSFAETRYGCGYAIYYDSGNPKFLLEEQSFFFQDKKIMDITPNNPVVRKINKEILFNEITVGFSKYAKPNDSGTSEGFSTQSEYLTPIEKDQNKATYLSDIIGDGTEIERVRRNGIKNADDESDEKDDDLFVIKISEFGSSNEYSPSDYGSGDDLNIQRDADNDRIIVNGLIILGLDSNDYIILDGYTNRQLTGSPILDYENNRTILPCTTETQNDTIYPDFYFAESDGSTQKRTYNPERLEGFNTITGLIDKNSVYNLDHANSQFLLHNFAWFGGGLTKKAGSSEVRFLRKKNITILSKAYDSATCGKTTSTISEDTNLTLTNLRSYDDEIFTEYLYEIKTNLSYTELVTLKEALRNESASDINYGYIEFDDNDGNAVEAFPMKVQYNPLSHECEIIAWGKNG